MNLKVFLQAILCAGLYPNIAATGKGIAEATLTNLKQFASLATKERPIWYDGRREVNIHPSSINSTLKEFQYPFIVFLEKVCALLLVYLFSQQYDDGDDNNKRNKLIINISSPCLSLRITNCKRWSRIKKQLFTVCCGCRKENNTFCRIPF